MATENFFDGAAFGYAVGHQQSHESTPPVEAVQEVKVITTTLLGAVRPHQRRVHRVHEQVGHQHASTAAPTSTSPTTPSTRTAFLRAGSARRRSATTTSASRSADRSSSPSSTTATTRRSSSPTSTTRGIRSGVLPGFGNTTPIDAFKNGDFSRAADQQPDWHRRAGTADLPGPDLQPGDDAAGQRHSGTRSVSRNVIPANDPLRSQVAARIAALMVSPDRAGDLEQRRRQPGRRSDLGARRAQHPVARRSQLHAELPIQPQLLLEPAAVGPQLRRRRRVRRHEDPAKREPAKNTNYYGDGFYQRISTHHAHQQFDWIIRNNLLNHSTVAYDRWFMGGNSPLGRRRLAAAALGARNQRRHPRHRRGPAV